MFVQNKIIPYQKLPEQHGVSITVKRLDLIHPTISGNKFFKLKYNFLEAQRLGYKRILSFGGAYSNHIFALAQAAHGFSLKNQGLHSIGIIRGQELQYQPLNPTLQTAQQLGMKLEFVSRQEYRKKHEADFLTALKLRYPDAYILPEGGTNALAIKGCEEILSEQDRQNYDVICCAVGTGGTIAGIINASRDSQHIIGFAALKGDFLKDEIGKWVAKNNWSIVPEDTFGGYGKFNQELLDFIDQINKDQDIPLEPIYTGKAFYQLLQLIQENHFPASTRILFIHTGGLQAFPHSV